jgi:rare lipoprotein A (peptidoglycan hydrolase)
MAIILAVHPSVPNLTESGVPVRGVASWYDATYVAGQGHVQTTWYTRAGYKFYAAVGSFKWGDAPYSLKVCRADEKSRCVIVSVVDRCSRCRADVKKPWTARSRAIDLSPWAFSSLRGLHLGVVRVIIEEIQPGT